MKLEDLMTELAKMATHDLRETDCGDRGDWIGAHEELKEMVVGIVPVVGKLVKVAEAAVGLTLHLGKNARLTHEYLCALKKSVSELEATP